MEEEEQGSSPKLPPKIIEEIFSKLPVKSLMRFRCVSKQWRSLYIDPGFITKLLNRSTQKCPTHILVTTGCRIYTSEIESGTQVRETHFLFDEPLLTNFRVVASCDGLVCLSRWSTSFDFKDYLCLYNPATRERLLLPKDLDCSSSSSSTSSGIFGLGFDPKTKEYKVVKITRNYKDQCNGMKTSVQIYTLGSHRWRTIPHSLPYEIPDQFQNACVAVGAAGHWLTSHVKSFPYRHVYDRVISFDFQREVFQEVPLPKKTIANLCLGVLGGCLSISSRFFTESVDVWVMKEYGVEESWTKLFSIDPVGAYYYRHILPLVFWKDGEILLWKVESHELILYNPKSKTETKPGFCYLPHSCTWTSYKESLVRLRVGIGGGATNELEVEKKGQVKVRKTLLI